MNSQDFSDDRMQLQDILMEIANNFINVPLENTNEVINTSLATMGEFTNTDRAYVFVYDHENRVSSNTYEWCREGIVPQIDELQDVPYDAISDWTSMHFAGKSMVISDVLSLDPESTIRQILEPQEIKSLIAIPMMDGDVCTGFVGFDSVRSYHTYTEKEQKLLELFALMLVNVNKRNYTQTQLNQAIIKAETASKAKSEFLANMSHEIRTPLNGVIGFTDLLKNTSLSPVQQQYVENAIYSAHSLLGIINDILDFSKIEAGMMDFEIVKTDMRELLYHALDVVRATAEKKGLKLLADIDNNLPRFAFTDPVRLKQVFTNLLSNAVKFTMKGEVELTARFESESTFRGKLFFSIRDTGIGITDTQKENLFKPFAQGDTSTTRKFGGTGLGLIISDRIAQNLGSKIQIDNSSDKGTVFFFELSTQVENDAEHNSTDLSGSYSIKQDVNNQLINDQLSTSNSKKILIAEDVEMNMLMLKAQLSSLLPDSQIIEAKNGLQAVELFKSTSPDLIIMDLHMPEMDGLDATKNIRNLEIASGTHVPIIALTADAFINQQENCLKAGMDDFLTKPLELNKLINVLGRYSLLNNSYDSSHHFNEKKLMNRCANKKEIVDKLLEMVQQDLPIQLELLSGYLRSGDKENLSRQAHRIKGTSLNAEFPILSAIAAKLEKLAKSEENLSSSIEKIYNELLAEWEEVKRVLQSKKL